MPLERGQFGEGSHLLQMRGLKPQLNALTTAQTQVASFTDAWIETYCQ